MPIPALRDALAALIKEGTKYPGKRATFLADFALYAFVTDVREHARAVELLSVTDVSRASFANARAALESAVDAAFLVSNEREYLYRGAQARVAELYEIHELESRASPLDPQSPQVPAPRTHPEDAVIADAKSWDEDGPGLGNHLRRAWETFTKDLGAVRKHWSLLSKEQVFEAVFSGDEAKVLAGMTDVIHALLSMASHPRMRVGSRDIEFTDQGGILFGTRGTDGDMAGNVAALACVIATSSLQKRRTFQAPS